MKYGYTHVHTHASACLLTGNKSSPPYPILILFNGCMYVCVWGGLFVSSFKKALCVTAFEQQHMSISHSKCMEQEVSRT